MSLALWCVLFAGLLPLLTTGIAKSLGGRGEAGRFDNAHPRAWQQRLTGIAARAHGAHLNGFEVFPLFAVAVLVAESRAAPAMVVDAMALSFVLVRLVYIALYLADAARLRTLVWTLGLLVTLAIFTSPVWA